MPNNAIVPININIIVSESNITLLTSYERQTKDINEI